MIRCYYDRKMEEMLGTGTYRRPKRDPAATQKNRLNRKFKELKNWEISSAFYNNMRPTGSQIYGLPTRHAHIMLA